MSSEKTSWPEVVWVAGGGGGDPDQQRQARRGHRGGPGRHQRATGVQCPPRPCLLRRRQRQRPRPLHSRPWLILVRPLTWSIDGGVGVAIDVLAILEAADTSWFVLHSSSGEDDLA
uniref:Uncharacterized protein n=1 Tax=Zea mays TaxID=4577 RepID=A0A804RQP1_MAIZE